MPRPIFAGHAALTTSRASADGWPESRGLTLVGIALTNLSDEAPYQLTLPFDHTRELDMTLDSIRERFGSGAIMRGVLVGHDPGPWVPLLPD